MVYAGFWKRLAAAWIDTLVTGAIWTIIAIIWSFYDFYYVFRLETFTTLEELKEEYAVAQGYSVAISLAIAWVYFSVFESSSKQGTLGKLAVGIKVTDMHGNRIGVGIAIGRNFCKLFSMLIVFIGFIMLAFTKRKQGLHDMMSGCLVINRDAQSTPNSAESREDTRID